MNSGNSSSSKKNTENFTRTLSPSNLLGAPSHSSVSISSNSQTVGDVKFLKVKGGVSQPENKVKQIITKANNTDNKKSHDTGLTK